MGEMGSGMQETGAFRLEHGKLRDRGGRLGASGMRSRSRALRAGGTVMGESRARCMAGGQAPHPGCFFVRVAMIGLNFKEVASDEWRAQTLVGGGVFATM